METTMTAIVVAAQGQRSPIGQRRVFAHPRRRRRDLANDGAWFRIAARRLVRPRPKTREVQLAISMSRIADWSAPIYARW